MIPFPTTHRSIFERVRSENPEVRRLAFGDLAEGYWRPSYHYLRLQWRQTPEAAEDLVQAFFTTAFEKSYLEKYDPSKAKFRTFLRTCLDRFVQNAQKADRAAKRGGTAPHLPLDFPGAEREVAALATGDLRDLDRFFRDETIRSLFARTVDAMRQALTDEGKPVVFRVFELHDVQPAVQPPLQPAPDTSYATVAAACDLTVAQVTNYLHAARRRFREMALDHLRAICGTDDEFREEARDLFGLDVAS